MTGRRSQSVSGEKPRPRPRTMPTGRPSIVAIAAAAPCREAFAPAVQSEQSASLDSTERFGTIWRNEPRRGRPLQRATTTHIGEGTPLPVLALILVPRESPVAQRTHCGSVARPLLVHFLA